MIDLKFITKIINRFLTVLPKQPAMLLVSVVCIFPFIANANDSVKSKDTPMANNTQTASQTDTRTDTRTDTQTDTQTDTRTDTQKSSKNTSPSEMNHGKMEYGNMTHGDMTHDAKTHGNMNHAQMNHTDHGHTAVDVSTWPATPSLTLTAHKDAMSGWNLHIQPTHFDFAPDQINAENVTGKGHAHLYINGNKITRLYSSWFYLNNLQPGVHAVTVSLNANDHGPLVLNEQMISATIELVQE